MTIKEYNETIARPVFVELNKRFIERVADLLNDIRMQYLSGEISHKEYEEKTQQVQDRLMELCRVETEES